MLKQIGYIKLTSAAHVSKHVTYALRQSSAACLNCMLRLKLLDRALKYYTDPRSKKRHFDPSLRALKYYDSRQKKKT